LSRPPRWAEKVFFLMSMGVIAIEGFYR